MLSNVGGLYGNVSANQTSSYTGGTSSQQPSALAEYDFTGPFESAVGLTQGGTVQVGAYGASASTPWAAGYSANAGNTDNPIGNLGDPFGAPILDDISPLKDPFGEVNPNSPILDDMNRLGSVSQVFGGGNSFGSALNPYAGTDIPNSDGSINFSAADQNYGSTMNSATGIPGSYGTASEGGSYASPESYGGEGMSSGYGNDSASLEPYESEGIESPYSGGTSAPSYASEPTETGSSSGSSGESSIFSNPSIFGGTASPGELQGLGEQFSQSGDGYGNQFDLLSDGVSNFFLQSQTNAVPQQDWYSRSYSQGNGGLYTAESAYPGGIANAGQYGAQTSGNAFAMVQNRANPSIVTSIAGEQYDNTDWLNQGFTSV